MEGLKLQCTVKKNNNPDFIIGSKQKVIQPRLKRIT